MLLFSSERQERIANDVGAVNESGSSRPSNGEISVQVIRDPRRIPVELMLSTLVKQFLLWYIVNQERIGNLIDRCKMLSQPPILSRISIDSDKSIDRHHNSTCLRLAGIDDGPGMMTEILRQVPLVTAPIQVRIRKMLVSQFSVYDEFVKIRYEMRIV